MSPRLAVLSHAATFYTTRRLLEAAAAAGCEATLLDPVRVWLAAAPGAPPLRGEGGLLPTPDVVIPRVGVRLATWELALLRALLAAGARSPAAPDALALAADKLATAQALAGAGVAAVPTVAVREPAHVEAALAAVGGPPVVIKRRRGSRGEGVAVARDERGARALVAAALAEDALALLQPLVPQATPHDLRVLVVGGAVAAVVRRDAAPGELRANVHLGARVRAVPAAPEAAALAVAAARAVGLPTCGVDLLPGPEGLAVLEVNGSPGLEAAERATGRDLAALLVADALARARGGAAQNR